MPRGTATATDRYTCLQAKKNASTTDRGSLQPDLAQDDEKGDTFSLGTTPAAPLSRLPQATCRQAKSVTHLRLSDEHAFGWEAAANHHSAEEAQQDPVPVALVQSPETATAPSRPTESERRFHASQGVRHEGGFKTTPT